MLRLRVACRTGFIRGAFDAVANLRRRFGLQGRPLAGRGSRSRKAESPRGLRPIGPAAGALGSEPWISGSESNRGGCSRRSRATLSDSHALGLADPRGQRQGCPRGGGSVVRSGVLCDERQRKSSQWMVWARYRYRARVDSEWSGRDDRLSGQDTLERRSEPRSAVLLTCAASA